MKDCSQVSRKKFDFQGVSSAFQKAFPIPALFKELSDLREPCSNESVPGDNIWEGNRCCEERSWPP